MHGDTSHCCCMWHVTCEKWEERWEADEKGYRWSGYISDNDAYGYGQAGDEWGEKREKNRERKRDRERNRENQVEYCVYNHRNGLMRLLW